MAIAISDTSDNVTVRMTFQSVTGDEATKVFELDGAIADADLEQLVEDIDLLSNAKITQCTVSGVRQVTGMDASASSSSQNLVSALAFLTFTKVNPLNALKTVKKTFSIPAYADGMRDTDNTVLVAAPGSGSIAARVGRVIATIEDNLEYLGADGTFYPGGFTYDGSQSGFGTVNDVIDSN